MIRIPVLFVLSVCFASAYDAQPPDCNELGLGEEYIHPGEDVLVSTHMHIRVGCSQVKPRPSYLSLTTAVSRYLSLYTMIVYLLVQNDLNAKLMAEVVMRRDAPGHAFRAFHPKTLGCLHGEFTVNKQLAEDLTVGLFQPGATYRTIAHFATSTPIHPPGKLSRPGGGPDTLS